MAYPRRPRNSRVLCTIRRSSSSPTFPMPRSRRPAGELLGAGQDPLPGAPLFPRPSATSSSSGRARSRVSAQVRVARLANHALRVLRALFTGDLTSVAADSEVPWGSNKVWDGAREIERQVSLRVHGCCQHAFDSGVYAEEGESAFGRLTSTGPYPGPSASSQDGVCRCGGQSRRFRKAWRPFRRQGLCPLAWWICRLASHRTSRTCQDGS